MVSHPTSRGWEDAVRSIRASALDEGRHDLLVSNEGNASDAEC